MSVTVIIPAAGSGKRVGGILPKQFIKVNKKEIIVHTLEIFQQSRLVNQIVVAVSKEHAGKIARLKKKYNLTKLTKIVEGGKERQDSVYNALLSLSLSSNDLVAVHDAARPLLPQKVLTEATKTAKIKGNAVVAIKARDTLLRQDDQHAINYIDRTYVYSIQTPQIFKYGDLITAFKKAYEENIIGTDESMLIARSGGKINLVEGDLINFKVTTQGDLSLLKKLLR